MEKRNPNKQEAKIKQCKVYLICVIVLVRRNCFTIILKCENHRKTSFSQTHTNLENLSYTDICYFGGCLNSFANEPNNFLDSDDLAVINAAWL